MRRAKTFLQLRTLLNSTEIIFRMRVIIYVAASRSKIKFHCFYTEKRRINYLFSYIQIFLVRRAKTFQQLRTLLNSTEIKDASHTVLHVLHSAPQKPDSDPQDSDPCTFITNTGTELQLLHKSLFKAHRLVFVSFNPWENNK